MEALGNTPPCLMMDDDDIFNFSLDDGDDAIKTIDPLYPSSNLNSTNPPDDHSRSFPDFPEEELEWLLNKDAFPAVETGLDIFMPNQNHLQSPISVLENSTSSSNSNGSTSMNYCGALPIPVSFPVRARSKRRRRRRRGFPELPVQQVQQQSSWWNQVNIKNVKQEFPKPLPVVAVGSAIGRRCQHCLAEKTPQWRAGPLGPKTLCNACGVRYKSGRLVPEYRPASSPTFSSQLHSNSHRKIMEMRKHTQVGDMMVK